MTDTPGPIVQAGGLRALVLVIGGLETALLLAFLAVMLQSTDPLGAAIGQGMALLVSVPYLLFALPGILLAYLRRALPLALTLVMVAIPVVAYFWRHA